VSKTFWHWCQSVYETLAPVPKCLGSESVLGLKCPYTLSVSWVTGQLRRECYPSMRTENKGLLALSSVRQWRWVHLLLDRFGFSVTCTLL